MVFNIIALYLVSLIPIWIIFKAITMEYNHRVTGIPWSWDTYDYRNRGIYPQFCIAFTIVWPLTILGVTIVFVAIYGFLLIKKLCKYTVFIPDKIAVFIFRHNYLKKVSYFLLNGIRE